MSAPTSGPSDEELQGAPAPRWSRNTYFPVIIGALALTGFGAGAAVGQSNADRASVPGPESSGLSQNGLGAAPEQTSIHSSDRGPATTTTTTGRPVEITSSAASEADSDTPEDGHRPSAVTPQANVPVRVPQPAIGNPGIPVAPAPAPRPAPAEPRSHIDIDFAPLPPQIYDLDGGTVRFR